jgi:ATP-dependent DNA helicase DinG
LNGLTSSYTAARWELEELRQILNEDYPVQAEKRFSEKSIKLLREEIADAGGNEVFALGFLDDKGLVDRIEVLARGNEASVLVISRKMESADVFIHNHPSGYLSPSDNDLAVAARASESGVGAFIVDNRVEQVYVAAECVKRRKTEPLDGVRIIAALEEGGVIARALPAYEKRQSQLDLMALIIRGFNEDALTAAEAGTGVGKSFAYLLPALCFALANDERIVISTATITLQQQLFEKDIPLVLSGMKKTLKAALIKGRGNYLCRRRLWDALQEPLLDDRENDEFRAILAWADTSKTGSRSDLSFLPADGLWSRICSDSENCMGMRCPEREACFFMAVRREASDARILVVNHHLLFADLAARYEGAGYEGTVVLPPYNRVIIDEAHTIEGAATSFFSEEFSRLGLFRHLGRLYRRRVNPAGLLVRLANTALGREEADEFIDKAAEIVQRTRDDADSLDQAALELCTKEGVFRLTSARLDAVETALAPHLLALQKDLASLGGMTREMLGTLTEEQEDDNIVWEVKALLRRLDSIGTISRALVEFTEAPEKVMWIERHKGAGSDWASFIITPLDVAAVLKESLFAPNKTVICVSATLSIAGSFNYWASRSGFGLAEGRQSLTGIFPSPFPYASSVLLAVPQDAPLPDEPAYRSFVDRAAAELTASAGGSALILFTSYEALKSAYTASRSILEEQGIRCLKQGDDDRSRLLDTFLRDESSALFATDSFWEGIDAPGDTLRLVILCRLPFKAPNDPVFEARCEALEKRGISSFMELSLPESVMKFKQGFGRLMRRSSDHGVVAVLDGRLVRKRYGDFFLRSLPETRRSFAPFSTVLREAERFLYSPSKT